MTDNNDTNKLKLNLGAKEFKPKTFTPQTNTTTNTNQVYNPMMQGIQGNYMNNMNMNMGNIPMTNNQQGFYPQTYQPYNMNQSNQGNLNSQNIPKQSNTISSNKPTQQNQTQNQNQKKKEEKPKEPKKEEKKITPTTNNKQSSSNNVQKQKSDVVKIEKTEVKETKIEEIEDVGDVISKEGKMVEVDETRDPAAIVFIGHVDHGKSTICGNILLLTGQVDQRTIEKYKSEAIKNKRESWYLAYLMDQNDEEKEKGKTVEIGKANFVLSKKRYTILDGPGHSGFLPNLLLGACQADFACLVISAKDGEFEAGFEKSGSTREHALLAKSLGVNKVVMVINKMDEETVNWSEKRFNTIRNSLFDYLKKIGYKEDDVYWVPVSGLHGDNIKEKLSKEKAPWYNGPSLFEVLDDLPVINRDTNGPVRFSILDRYKEGGMQIMGKVESGILKYGNSYTLMPNKQQVEVQWIFNSEENGIPYAKAGESVRVST